jgi:imidazolonepropionase-like amidohydrolase
MDSTRPWRATTTLARRRIGAVLMGMALVALVAGEAVAQPQPTMPQTPPHFAITNARIVPVSGPVLESGTVVVRDGVIRAVGARVAVPGGAAVVDGTGLTVYPGLIDAFGTLGLPEPRGGAGAGTRPDVPHSWGPEDRPATFTWRRAADDVDVSDLRIARWREAGYTSALTTHGTGFFPGAAAIINLAGDRGRELVVKPDVAQRVNLSARGFPGYPGSLMGAFAYVKQLHFDARHYDQVWSAYERNPRGATRPEYDRVLEPLRTPSPLLFPVDGRKEIQRAIATAREVERPVILYGAQRGYEAADLLRGAGVPVLVDLDWPRAPRDGDPEADFTLAQLRTWEHAPTTPALLHQAGVPFAFYTGGLTDPSLARARARAAVDAGLPPDAALRALTLSPAEILGVADRMGSIEAGKIANLVLVRGDLLDPEARVEAVVVDGRSHAIFQPSTADAAGGEARSARGGRGGAGSDQEGSPAGPRVAMVTDRGPYRDDPVTLIRNATVITMAGETIEGGDVLVRNGRIAAVGRGLGVPGNARVVDATGMYVTPGIIDAHSHLASDAVNEGTVNVSAMVGIRDVLDNEDVGIYRALAGGVTAANVLHGSANPIGGRNAVLKLRWGADAAGLLFEGAPPGIKFALGENVKRERTPPRYPATRMGQQDVIRQAFLDGQEYQRQWDEYNGLGARARRDAVPPRRDLKLETLAQLVTGERKIHAHGYRSDEFLQLLRTAEEFGITIATLQHVLEGYRIADEIAAHGAGASTFSDWWAFKVEAYDAIPYNAALMADRGVLVSINSDSPEEIRHLNQEAAKAMKWGGLSAMDALALVTINPAIQLGVADRVGSIEVGKDADLAVWDGHPLSTGAKVVQTYVDGRLYFDRDLDRARHAAMAAEKAELEARHRPARSSTTVADGPGEDTRGTADARAGLGGAGSGQALAGAAARQGRITRTDDVVHPRAASADEVLAIRGGTVHPVAGVPYVGTVVVQGGRITAAGPDVAIPGGARVIDATGRHVYPGLFDAGSQLGLTEIGQVPVTMDFAELGDYTPHLQARTAVHPASEHIPVARANGITHTLSLPSGGRGASRGFPGQGSVVHLDGWTIEEMDVLPAAVMVMDWPVIRTTMGGWWGGGAPQQRSYREAREEYERAVHEMATWLDAARDYQHAIDGGASMPRDLRLEALAPVARGEVPVMVRVDAERDIRNAIEFADRHGLRLILAGGRDSYRVAELLAARDIPVILGPTQSLPGGPDRPYDEPYATPGLLHAAGVRFAIATFNASDVRTLPYEAAMGIPFGLPRDAALRAITAAPAEILGIGDHLGTIQPGRIANLIVTDGDPLEIQTQVEHLIIAGQEVSTMNRHRALYEQYKARPVVER